MRKRLLTLRLLLNAIVINAINSLAMSGYAYVTLLTSETYLPGALVLAHSLRETGTQHRIVAVVAEGALGERARDALTAAFDLVIETAPVRTRAADAANLQLLGRPDLDETQTKLRVWSPDVLPFERIVFLDADVLVLRNVDELFAFVDGPEVVFAAAPDVGWPDCFNSGVFVAKPDAQIYERLLAHAATHGSFDGGDQGILNSFFSSWSRESAQNARTARLPFVYNVTPSAFYSYVPAFQHFASDIAIVHFTGEAKPWRWSRFANGSVIPRGGVPSQTLGLIQQWWSVFDKFQVHVALRNLNLDRNWSLYQPPQTDSNNAGGHSGNNSGFGNNINSDTQAEFANYRANWNEREMQGVTKSAARSRSRSPVKSASGRRSNHSPIKKSLSPVLATTPGTGHTSRPNSPLKSPFQKGSPHVETADISALYGADSVMTRMETPTPPTSDFGSYRVGWDPRELRGNQRVSRRSTSSNEPPSRSSSVEDMAFSSDEEFTSAEDLPVVSATAQLLNTTVTQQKSLPPPLARSAELQDPIQIDHRQIPADSGIISSRKSSGVAADHPRAPITVPPTKTAAGIPPAVDAEKQKFAPTLTSAPNTTQNRVIATDNFTISPHGVINYHPKK